MRFDGMNFRKSQTLGWRNSEHGDVNSRAEQVRPNEVVIVKIKDCEVYEEKDERGNIIRRAYKSKGAPQAVKLTYTLTNMGYGPWKTKTVTGIAQDFPRMGVLYQGQQYRECRVYLVRSSRVYTTVIRQRVEEKV